jgi:hypothetical protein
MIPVDTPRVQARPDKGAARVVIMYQNFAGQ